MNDTVRLGHRQILFRDGSCVLAHRYIRTNSEEMIRICSASAAELADYPSYIAE